MKIAMQANELIVGDIIEDYWLGVGPSTIDRIERDDEPGFVYVHFTNGNWARLVPTEKVNLIGMTERQLAS